MTTLLNIALINAVTVVPLALVAYGIGKLFRRPALTHAVWVLVLLKFVTPPLFFLPVTIELPNANLAADQRESMAVNDSRSTASAADSTNSSRGPVTNDAAIGGRDSDKASGSSDHSVRPAPAGDGLWQKSWSGCVSIASAVMTRLAQRPDIISLLAVAWLAGAVGWMTLQAARAIRFHRRILRNAVVSWELQRETQQIGNRLGLQHVPQVLIVDVALSPLLWGFSPRTRLLFPSDLLERLNPEARATLLTHELAHFARRDHWVRMLELIATGIFWWHPVAWWARQQIEESEEECCDAWVVSEYPETPRQYAEALLDTIDFLCEARQSLSPVATGLGQSHFLRLRLTKIMRGNAPKSLSPRIRWAVGLMAVSILPLQPFVLGAPRIIDVRQPSIEPVVVSVDSHAVRQAAVEIENTVASAPEVSMAPTTVAPVPAPMLPSSSRFRAARGAKVWSTAASPDGRFVARATTARQLILTDRTSNREFELSAQQVTSIAFLSDGESFVAAGSDGRVTLWDAANGELLRTILTHTDGLRSIAVSSADGSVAVGGRDGAVLMFDLATGRSMGTLPVFSSAVNCVRFSPDGRQLAVATGDWNSDAWGTVMLVNVADGQAIVKLDCPTTPGALSFASNEELIVGMWNGHAQLWNLTNQQVVGVATSDKNVIAAAAFSPDNPALLEVTFAAAKPASSEMKSPFTILQELLGTQ